MFSYIYETIIGKITLVSDKDFLIRLDFGAINDFPELETPVIKEAYKQLSEYFDGKRKIFDLPLKPMKSTEFQRKVWKSLCTIPYGETWSYKQLAKSVGNEKACRAVGGANNKNNIPIIIPCHRVIGSNGSLIGFAGRLDIKQQLLDLERKFK